MAPRSSVEERNALVAGNLQAPVGAVTVSVARVAMLERRKEQRLPIFLDGKIGFSGRRFRVSCMVQNISSSGAKLVLHNAADLPSEFSLTIISKIQVAYGVRTRWRQHNSIGVEIEHSHVANAGDVPPAFALEGKSGRKYLAVYSSSRCLTGSF